MGTMESRLVAVELEIFKCQGMVEHGLSANHSMIMEFTHDLKVDGRPLEDIVFTLNEQINFLQGQIFDLQNKIFEYEARFKGSTEFSFSRSKKLNRSQLRSALRSLRS
ncbi:40S ribosomal protein S5-1 [Hordeum vulgare]|nr:40S ribosomal protein S5-1 [Hordeum vulgare]